MEEADSSSKWSFLRANEFFSTTSFSGWSFVEAATTKIEIIFWYILLSVFAVITIYNVCGVVERFNSDPTQVTIEMVITIDDIRIGNISLTLTFQFAEFSKIYPLKWTSHPSIYSFDYDNRKSAFYREPSSSAVRFLACEAGNPRKYDDYLAYQAMDEIRYAWYEKLLNWMEPINTTGTNLANYTIGDDQIFDEWNSVTSERFNNLYGFLAGLGFDKLSNSVMVSLDDAVTSALHQYFPYKLEYLFTLHAMKSGIDPRLDFFHSMKEKDFDPNLWVNAEKKEIWDQFMAKELNPKYAAMFGKGSSGFLDSINATSFDVFKWAMAGLNELLHFSTDTPNATFFFSDFSYSIGTTAHRDKFHLSIDVKVPPATKNLTVVINSMYRARFELIYEALNNAIYARSLESAPCEGLDLAAVNNAVEKLLLHHGYFSFLTIYDDDYADLIIETADGSTFRLEALYKHKLNLKTNIHFSSQIEDCYAGSFKECNDECINEQYLEHCKCYPWTLYYLNQHQGNMCDGPCSEKGDIEIRQECQDACGEMLKHPCSSYNFGIDQKEAISDWTGNWNLPIYQFTIAPAKRNYPQIKEQYSMSANVLAGELGGQLELWMGINVIGFVHFLIYVIKQINNARHPHTKAGRIIRSCCGKWKTNNNIEPSENETNTNVVHKECVELTNQSKLVALQLNVDQLNRQFAAITAEIKVIKNLIEKQP